MTLVRIISIIIVKQYLINGADSDFLINAHPISQCSSGAAKGAIALIIC